MWKSPEDAYRFLNCLRNVSHDAEEGAQIHTSMIEFWSAGNYSTMYMYCPMPSNVHSYSEKNRESNPQPLGNRPSALTTELPRP